MYSLVFGYGRFFLLYNIWSGGGILFKRFSFFTASFLGSVQFVDCVVSIYVQLFGRCRIFTSIFLCVRLGFRYCIGGCFYLEMQWRSTGISDKGVYFSGSCYFWFLVEQIYQVCRKVYRVGSRFFVLLRVGDSKKGGVIELVSRWFF